MPETFSAAARPHRAPGLLRHRQALIEGPRSTEPEPLLTWPDAPDLQAVLLVAMQQARVPLMLIQAGDDLHLTPTYVLGGELARLGRPHETRIYQTIGNQRGDGHGVFNKAVWLWKQDVERFLARWMSPAAPQPEPPGGQRDVRQAPRRFPSRVHP